MLGESLSLAHRQRAAGFDDAGAKYKSIVAHLYRATGMTSDEADAQAFLFYCFIFGQSLLFLGRGPRKRAQLVAKSAEKLIEDEA